MRAFQDVAAIMISSALVIGSGVRWGGMGLVAWDVLGWLGPCLLAAAGFYGTGWLGGACEWSERRERRCLFAWECGGCLLYSGRNLGVYLGGWRVSWICGEVCSVSVLAGVVSAVGVVRYAGCERDVGGGTCVNT